MSTKKEEQKLEIKGVHFGTEIFEVNYTIDGLKFCASDDNVSEKFEKAMKAMLPHLAEIKELPDEIAKDYRCNAVSLSCNSTSKGESRSVIISGTKVTSAGRADNLNTAKCLYDTHNAKAKGVLPQKAKLDIEELIRQAKDFIKGNRRMRRLYSQPDLEAAA